MTIAANNPNRVTQAGDGSTTSMPLTPLIFFDDSSLRVTVVDDTTGVETLQTITTDYTVSGGSGATGTVTFVTAPALGETAVVERQEPFAQPTDFITNGALNAQTVEDQMDRLVLQILRNEDLISRAILVPTTFTGSQLAFPVPEANKFLRGNTAADGFDNVDISSLGTIGVPIAVADGGTGATTAAGARTALSVPESSTVALLSGTNAMAGDYTFSGDVNLDGPTTLGPATELTIASGAITPTGAYHTVDTESDAASDDLDTLDDANMTEGAIVLIRAVNAARTVVVKHAASGNHTIQTADGMDFDLDDDVKRIWLQLQGTEWKEVARSTSAGGSGTIAQVATTATVTAGSGTTQTPDDDTIPQITEGNAVLSAASFTPQNASSTLLITVTIFYSVSTAVQTIFHLHKDSDADAIYATSDDVGTGEASGTVLEFSTAVAAGDTAARTYSLRAGLSTAGTLYWNSNAGAARFGAAGPETRITIQEVLP